MNVFETIDELFAQVSYQLQQPNTTVSQFDEMMKKLKTQVICTIAIANQSTVSHVVASLQDIHINMQNGQLYCDPQ